MHAETVNSPEAVTAQVRILVADDHEVMRMGIRNLLEARPNWNICAEAANGKEAVEKALANEPDIIIMDITMPQMNGLEAAGAIAKVRPKIPVILFSLHLSDEVMRNFDNPAIRGAVSKGEAARDLVDAVEKVLHGGTFFPNKKNAGETASKRN
jgi:DNA-binding NarL/FixJ family response regulator